MTKRSIAVGAVIVVIAIIVAACIIVVANDNKTVTYDYNYDGAPANEKVSYKTNSTIDGPKILTREGYDLVGYYTDKGCTNEVEFPYKVTGDVTFYAKWTKHMYTVSFNLNFTPANAVSYYEVSAEYGAIVNAPAKDPVRVACDFNGWFEDIGCTVPAQFPYTVTGDKTFYAKWSEADISEYLNADFYTDTVYGQYLVDSHEETADYEIFKIGGTEVKTPLVSSGLTCFVFLKPGETNTYTVTDADDYSNTFDITYSENIQSVRVYSLKECCCEFVEVRTSSGYYIHDLHYGTNNDGIGPSSTKCETVLNELVLIGDKCYSFDTDGNFNYEFSFTSTHRPSYGDVDSNVDKRSYSEIETYYVDGVMQKRANILNYKFDVVKTMEYPVDSIYNNCFFISDGRFLFQYAVAVSSDSDNVSFFENGQAYQLTSLIVKSNGSYIASSIRLPAVGQLNLNNEMTVSSMLADDIDNIIIFNAFDPVTKELKDNSTIFVCLNSDGSIYKAFAVTDRISSVSAVFPLVNTDYFRVISTKYVDGKKVGQINIVDIIGKKMILNDVVSNSCMKYFIVADAVAKGDFNIYNADGQAVGTFSGKTYVGSTNNDLFFKDEATGKMYIFCDGAMTELTDYVGEMVCKNSFYGYKASDGTYTYYTENGTQICKCKYNNVNEKSMLNGHYIVVFMADYDSGLKSYTYETYTLTSEVV